MNNYHHGNLKNALISAGLAILKDEGLQKLSLRSVAKRARVSHNAPYRHYKTLEDFTADLAIQGFEQLQERLKDVQNRANDPKENFKKLAKHYIQFALENPDLYRTMFGNFDVSKYSKLQEITLTSFYELQNIIRSGQKKNVIKQGDTGRYTLVTWTSLHGLTNLIIDKRLPKNTATQTKQKGLINDFINILFSGLESTLHETKK